MIETAGVVLLGAFSAWCVAIALVGLNEEARKRWEQQVVLWTGRVLVCIGSAAAVTVAAWQLISTIGRMTP